MVLQAIGDNYSRPVSGSGVGQVNSGEEMIFTKKLNQSVLVTPAPKEKETTVTSEQKERRSILLANKPKSALNMEQQATALLMKKCGLLKETEALDQGKEEEFRNQFVDPIQEGTVTSYWEAFGLQLAGGTDYFSAIVLHAEA